MTNETETDGPEESEAQITLRRHPDEILQDFEDAMRGVKDSVDLYSVLWEIISDINDSWCTALSVLVNEGILSSQTMDDITEPVMDYVVNHYGEP